MMVIHGKIFVVAFVLAVIFVGLALFLFYLERRLKKLERNVDNLEQDRSI